MFGFFHQCFSLPTFFTLCVLIPSSRSLWIPLVTFKRAETSKESKNEHQGRFPFVPKFRKFPAANGMSFSILKFPKKGTTLRGIIPKFWIISYGYREFLFYSIWFAPGINFQNFWLDGLYFRNWKNLWFSGNLPRKFPFHLPSFLKFRNLWWNAERPILKTRWICNFHLIVQSEFRKKQEHFKSCHRQFVVMDTSCCLAISITYHHLWRQAQLTDSLQRFHLDRKRYLLLRVNSKQDPNYKLESFK